jgi:hypothetical protein
MNIAKPALAYFAIAFGAGFLLGPIRVLWLVPQVGERAAELIEMPIMLVVIVWAARWIVRRFATPSPASTKLAIGAVALVLMLAAEFGLVLGLRGIPLSEYFSTRDPVAGAVYYLMLVLFAAMPWLVSRKHQ